MAAAGGASRNCTLQSGGSDERSWPTRMASSRICGVDGAQPLEISARKSRYRMPRTYQRRDKITSSVVEIDARRVVLVVVDGGLHLDGLVGLGRVQAERVLAWLHVDPSFVGAAQAAVFVVDENPQFSLGLTTDL